MRGLLAYLRLLAVTLVVVAIAAAVAETPPLRRLDALVAAHRTPLLAVTASAAALGFVLFMGAVLDLLISSGRPGGAAHDEFTVAALKDAFRSGAWLRDAAWRRRAVVTFGALTMGFGIFGLLAVVGPGYVRVITGAALLYAMVRTAWAFARA